MLQHPHRIGKEETSVFLGFVKSSRNFEPCHYLKFLSHDENTRRGCC
jgi:hypothetical protein